MGLARTEAGALTAPARAIVENAIYNAPVALGAERPQVRKPGHRRLVDSRLMPSSRKLWRDAAAPASPPLMRPAPARTSAFDDLSGFLGRLLEHLAEPVQPGGASDTRQLLRVVGDEFRRFPVGH